MSNYVMIDLETLDTKDSAIVLSVGACAFNDTALQTYNELRDSSNTFYAEFNISEQEQYGRTIGLDTLKWWLKQPNFKLKSEEKESKFILPTTYFLNNLTHFTQTNGMDGVWSNSPSFDMNILKSLYQSFNIEFNIDFRKWLDFRTIKKITELLKFSSINFLGTRHNALDDAINQALFTNHVLTNIKTLSNQFNDQPRQPIKFQPKKYDIESEYTGPKIEDLDLIVDLNS